MELSDQPETMPVIPGNNGTADDVLPVPPLQLFFGGWQCQTTSPPATCTTSGKLVEGDKAGQARAYTVEKIEPQAPVSGCTSFLSLAPCSVVIPRTIQEGLSPFKKGCRGTGSCRVPRKELNKAQSLGFEA